jgi:hypothetical protein
VSEVYAEIEFAKLELSNMLPLCVKEAYLELNFIDFGQESKPQRMEYKKGIKFVVLKRFFFFLQNKQTTMQSRKKKGKCLVVQENREDAICAITALPLELLVMIFETIPISCFTGLSTVCKTFALGVRYSLRQWKHITLPHFSYADTRFLETHCPLLESISISKSIGVKNIQALQELPKIKRIFIRNFNLGKISIRLDEEFCKKLARVIIVVKSVPNKLANVQTVLRNCSNIENLTLKGVAVDALSKHEFPKMTTLALANVFGLPDIGHIRPFKLLRNLFVSFNKYEIHDEKRANDFANTILNLCPAPFELTLDLRCNIPIKLIDPLELRMLRHLILKFGYTDVGFYDLILNNLAHLVLLQIDFPYYNRCLLSSTKSYGPNLTTLILNLQLGYKIDMSDLCKCFPNLDFFSLVFGMISWGDKVNQNKITIQIIECSSQC